MFERKDGFDACPCHNDIIIDQIDGTRGELWKAVEGKEYKYINQAPTIKKCMLNIFNNEMLNEVLTYEFLGKLGELMDLYYAVLDGKNTKFVRPYMEKRFEIKKCLNKDSSEWIQSLRLRFPSHSNLQISQLSDELLDQFIDILIDELEYIR